MHFHCDRMISIRFNVILQQYSSQNSFFYAVIPFKTEMAVELQEKGRVRFWAHVAKFTSSCQVEYVFNDNIITQGKV